MRKYTLSTVEQYTGLIIPAAQEILAIPISNLQDLNAYNYYLIVVSLVGHTKDLRTIYTAG